MKHKQSEPSPEEPRFTSDDYKGFQTVIKEEYGKDISYDEAVVMMNRLISLYEIITRPLPGEKERKELGGMQTE